MRLGKEFWISFIALVAASLLSGFMSYGEQTPMRKALADFPLQIAPWQGRELGLEANVLEALKVDDYMMRQYHNEQALSVALYVGYYQSMRRGATYHSPKNCLPGSGWYIVQTDTTRLKIASQPEKAVKINKFIIQKGLQKQLVLYWYQDRGRVITSEYWAKVYMVWDAIFKRRTDGALVRLTVPFTDDNESTAFEQAAAFSARILPLLADYLPG